MSVSRYKDEVNQKVVKVIYSRSFLTGQCIIEIHKKSLQRGGGGVGGGGGGEGMVIACWTGQVCVRKRLISRKLLNQI